MSQTNKISIIVPIYNVESYLSRCIDSLLQQDYANIEIILVDDGSPDDCGRICDEYAQRDDRIKVIHKQNGGLSSARNAGLDVMTGDWVMCVDSDDWVEPNYCSYALDDALEMESDIVVFGYNDCYPTHTEPQKNVARDIKLTPKQAIGELHGGKILSFAWNKIYKASLFDGIRYPLGRLYEDIGTTYKLFAKANSVALTTGITYNYFKRDDSILGKAFSPKAAVDWFDLDMERLAFIQSKYPDLVPSLWQSYGNEVLRFIKTIASESSLQPKAKEMESFLKEHRKELKASGIKDVQYDILCYCPKVFYLLRRIKRLIKK